MKSYTVLSYTNKLGETLFILIKSDVEFGSWSGYVNICQQNVLILQSEWTIYFYVCKSLKKG